ncbi:hypothetical protein BDU57DRAFT_560412 [Ampelomyces quisqualis]|uniref:Uncharacterized protein n=1 Tax=Ampelomyces quisqualis TaxID=50730 RepID=A0A6A5Q6S3_AMPQU|nr:hypothetical protein BDU57DRAFT_560412 [Ampelomyces quisqualis]
MISLPLAKLSTANDAPLSDDRFTWTHETHNLFFVLDNYNARGQVSQLLKIVQGTQVRHSVEIERLINEGDELIRAMQERGIELKHEQLPISALVRSPLLAFRWQLPDKKVKRLQVKFTSSSDYDNAYNHLHQLGLRMSSTKTNQPRAPNSTSTAMTSPSTTANSPLGQVAPTAGPACPPSRLKDISSRPYTAVTAPTAIESQLQEAAHARPASAYAGAADSAKNRNTSFSGPLNPPEYFARPNSATSAVLDLSSPDDRPLTAIEQSPVSIDDRPDTALLLHRPDTAEAALPPRRELPFPRSPLPRSAGSDGTRPSSRPSTGIMGPPPLPARVASLRPASSRAANQELDLPPLPKPTILSSAQQQPSWMQQQPPRTPDSHHNTPTSTQISIYEDQENRPPSSSNSNFSPLSYKKSASNMPSSTGLLTDQHRRHTDSPSPLSTPPTSFSFQQTHVLAGPSAAKAAINSDDLAAYAMQSEEGRRAALNEFIYKQLENDNFLTLLEDTETCWARTGLGTK